VSQWLASDFSSSSSNQKASIRRQRIYVESSQQNVSCNKRPSKNSPYRTYAPITSPSAHPKKPRGSAGCLTAPRCACPLAKSQPRTRPAFFGARILFPYSTCRSLSRLFSNALLVALISPFPPPYHLRPSTTPQPRTDSPPTSKIPPPAAMSEQQPQSRGGFRGRGPRGDRGGRAGAPSSRSGAQKSGGGDTERPKKENILDLSKYLNKALRVKFSGGREGMADLVSPCGRL